MLANTALLWSVLQPLFALLGAAYIIVPLVEWKRHIALHQSIIFKRVLSWSLIMLIFLLALLVGVPFVLVLFALIARQACKEYINLARLSAPDDFLLRESAAIAIMVAAIWPSVFYVLPLIFLLALTVRPLITQKIEGVVENSAKALLGFVWINWTLGHALLLARMADGLAWLLIVAVSVALSDVGAGTIGMLFGRRKLTPVISPGKTWAGVVGNFIGAALGFVLMFALIPQHHTTLIALLIIVIALGSLWGDLIESLVKRASGVKDAGTWLPGFGGILDRIDSLLIVLPLAHYVINLS